MRVAMIGLGKLGLPVSCAMVQKGHEVFGFDTDASLREQYRAGACGLYEPDMEAVLTERISSGRFHIYDSLYQTVTNAEIIFIAVPTPSLESGAFDNSIVAGALKDIADCLAVLDPPDYRVVSVISTVLPGTVRREFLPVLEAVLGPPGDRYGLCYNAQFIAMGTVIENMLHPEFVLVGEYDEQSGDVLEAFYTQLTDAPILRMSIESAETVKVCYNTYIGFKIVIANAIMEVCDKVEHADATVAAEALKKATDRIVSARYMDGGLGDGGGCHPRDARALSYLANQLNLSYDPFGSLMSARDSQSRYLASVVAEEHERTGLPIAVLGLTFKPETNLTEDSPALLLIDHVRELGLGCDTYDPIIRPEPLRKKPYVYVLAMRHAELRHFKFHPGSVVVDPWRMLDAAPSGCELRSIGR